MVELLYLGMQQVALGQPGFAFGKSGFWLGGWRFIQKYADHFEAEGGENPGGVGYDQFAAGVGAAVGAAVFHFQDWNSNLGDFLMQFLG